MNDIFGFRKKLVEGYKKFSTSFVSPRTMTFAAEPSDEVKALCEDKGYEWRAQ